MATLPNPTTPALTIRSRSPIHDNVILIREEPQPNPCPRAINGLGQSCAGLYASCGSVLHLFSDKRMPPEKRESYSGVCVCKIHMAAVCCTWGRMPSGLWTCSARSGQVRAPLHGHTVRLVEMPSKTYAHMLEVSRRARLRVHSM